MSRIDSAFAHFFQFNCISIEEIDADYPEQEHALGDKRKRVLDDDTVRYHLEPFFAECRAFGKLVKEAKDNALAVRCHGHVLLSPELELRIKEQFGIQDWNRKPADEGQPLRAIVKDLIRTDSRFGHSSFCTMRKKIEKLNRLGIYNMDIREENYRDGRLFDFSSSITSPHPDLSPNLRSMDEIVEDMEDDVECFESMVREVHKTWMGKLRPRS